MAGNDVEIRIRVANQTAAGFNAVHAQLRRLQTAAARDFKFKVSLDDQTGPGIAAVKAAMRDLRAQRITISIVAEDQGVRRAVSDAVRFATYTGTGIGIPLTIEDPQQLRRDVNAAVRWARMNQSIEIPLRLDTAAALAQIAALRAGMTALNGTITATGGAAAQAGSSWKVMGGIAAAVLAGITVAAPIAAAAVATTLPLAFIGVGAAALKSRKDVTDAFDAMKNDVSTSIKEAAAPMAPFLIEGMRQAADGARDLKAPLSDAFKSASPLIEPVVDGIVNLATNAMPGFNAALSRSGPMMDAFGGFLGDIGTGLGGMFDAITRGNNQNLAAVWETLGDGSRDLLVSLGNMFGQLTRNESAIASVKMLFEGLTSAIDATTDIAEIFGPAIEAAISLAAGGAKGIAWVTEQYRGMFELISEGSKSSTGTITRMSTGVDGARVSSDLFAASAESVSEALARQRENTDSLITSLFALANASQSMIDAHAGMEQAIDDAMSAARDNAGALKMVNGELDLTGDKARDAWQGLSRLATETKRSAEETHATTGSWEQANAELERGRKNFIRAADAAGLTTAQAKRLANELITLPDGKTTIDLEREDALNGLDAVQREIKRTPGTKRVTVRTLSSAAIKALEAVGFKTRRLPDGRIQVTAKNGGALGSIEAVRRAMARLDGRVSTTYVRTIYNSQFRAALNKQAHGGVVGAQAKAAGGIVGATMAPMSRAAEGGPRGARTLVGEQGPEIVDLPVGSMVRPAGETRRLLRESGGGGSDRPIVIIWQMDGREVARKLIDPFRHEIGALGGNVQSALGRRRR